MDLSQLSVVDNHCHSLLREPVRDRDRFRLLFAEASGPAFAPFVPQMAYYGAAIAALADLLGVEPDEGTVLEMRAARDHEEWIALLLQSSNLDALLVDDGYPTPALVYTRQELANLAGCAIGHVWRLEVAAQELILRHESFDDLLSAWREGLRDLRGRGVISLKSIAAYRTGLDVAPPDEAGARTGFAALRHVAERDGQVRLADKPLLEYLLHEAMAAASEQGVPIQFHTGYGDPDTDLRLGNPLHLRCLYDNPHYQGAPIVLLHESYPYTREAAYLAAVYPHVYSDFSYAVPNVGRAELLAMTRAALAVAPYSKLLHSSDGHSIPEHVWLGAARGRDIVGRVLEEMVEERELTAGAAEDAAASILSDNVRRLYQLDSVPLTRPAK